MESKIAHTDGIKKQECDNCRELVRVEVDFKYEHFGDNHWFELERRHSLTNHAYWLIGILIGLMGAFGYLWINRITTVMFFLLMICTGVLCLVALGLAIYVAWPREYKTLEGSCYWNNHWATLSEYYKGNDDWEIKTFYRYKRDLINQLIDMEAENRSINNLREEMWMTANKIVIVIIIMVLLGVISIHFSDFDNEVKKVFMREVKIDECVQIGKDSPFITIPASSNSASSEEH